MTLRKPLIAILLAVPLAACAGNNTSGDSAGDPAEEASTYSSKDLKAVPLEDPKTEIKSIYAEMQSMNANSSCDTDADCDIIAVGQRACGGPSHYLPYSKKMSDETMARMRALAERSTSLATQINDASGMMSTCDVITPPQAVCAERLCVLVEQDNGLMAR